MRWPLDRLSDRLPFYTRADMRMARQIGRDTGHIEGYGEGYGVGLQRGLEIGRRIEADPALASRRVLRRVK